ncbi:MAG: ASKHA domain-containing protein, partial [Candidatus Thorarchaeota archaeon]
MDLKNKKIVIDFEPISRRVIVKTALSIYDLLSELSIPIRSICGGAGTCGKCKILIQKGKEYLNSPSNSEQKFLEEKEIEDGWRLACQVRIDVKQYLALESLNPPQFRIFLPNELILEDFKILTTGISKYVKLNPMVKKYFINVDKPSLEDPHADFERIVTRLCSANRDLNRINQFNIDFDLMYDLPNVLRENDHKITVVLWNNKTIIACEPGNTVSENYGIAFDIGTTTVVGYLINLNDGKIYALDSRLNSQTAYGEDVITRMTFIKNDKKNLKELNSVIINDINNILSKVCHNANIDPARIYEASIVGNSVMHHIFLGIDPTNIGLSPFVPVVQQELNIKAKYLDMNISHSGNVYTAPVISGFVGADTIGVILSSRIYEEKDLTLAIDIGTNGEIIIGNHKILAVGSCAAGSALEGAHISNGMRAAAGAIDTLSITPGSLEVSFSTIKNKEPLGICGSGLVDAISEMLRSKIITRSGNFNKKLLEHKRFNKSDKKTEFIIAWETETSLGKPITITQNDIRQVQMAKSAFYSGTRLILQHLKEKLDIKQVFLAGAF